MSGSKALGQGWETVVLQMLLEYSFRSPYSLVMKVGIGLQQHQNSPQILSPCFNPWPLLLLLFDDGDDGGGDLIFKNQLCKGKMNGKYHTCFDL